MKRILAVGLVLGVAASAQTVTDQYKVTLQPQHFVADMVTSQRLGATTVNVDGGLKLSPTGSQIRRSYQATRSYDFPTLGSDIPGAQVCAESFALTSTGTKYQDFCTPSTNLGMDAGTGLLLEATLSCRAVTDATYVKLCVIFSDAGTYNAPDAGWSTLTFGP